MQRELEEREFALGGEIKATRSRGGLIKGRVLNVCKGGWSVGIAGYVAFLPNNCVKPYDGRAKPPLGELLQFRILKIRDDIRNIVVEGPLSDGGGLDAESTRSPREATPREKMRKAWARRHEEEERIALGSHASPAADDMKDFWRRKGRGAAAAAAAAADGGRRTRRNAGGGEEGDRADGEGGCGRSTDVGGRQGRGRGRQRTVANRHFIQFPNSTRAARRSRSPIPAGELRRETGFGCATSSDADSQPCPGTRSPSRASTSASCTAPWWGTGWRNVSSRATRACSDTRCGASRDAGCRNYSSTFPFWRVPQRESPFNLTRPRPNSAELGPRARRIRPRDVGPGQARAHGDVRARGQALLRPAPPPVDDRRAVAL